MANKDNKIVKITFQEIKDKWHNKTIESEVEFFQFHNDLNLSKDPLIFRGQFCSKWPIVSSLYREYDKRNKWLIDKVIKGKSEEELNIEIFLKIAKVHYIKIKKDDSNIGNNIIRLLSRAQHFETSTPLIDFTSSFWNATWFSVSESHNNWCTCKEDCNSSIFLFNKKEEINKEITIDNFKTFNSNSKEIYKCAPLIDRGIAQKSFFMLHNSQDMITDYNLIKINIGNNLNNFLRERLNNFDVNSETIFPGLKGSFQSFLTNSKHILVTDGNLFCDKFLTENSIKNKEILLEQAIEKYNSAIKIDSKYIDAYFNLGYALFLMMLKRRTTEWILKYCKKIIYNFNKVIELNAEYADAYFNIGITFSMMSEAVKDKNIKLKYSKKAIDTFNKVIDLNSQYIDAYFNIIINYLNEASLSVDEKLQLNYLQ